MNQDTFPVKMQDLIDLSMKVAEHCPDLEVSPDSTIRSAITTINRAYNVPAPPAPEPSDLLPHQQRVVDEKRELDEKRAKLNAFFNTAIFGKLSSEEHDRLHRQYEFMVQYSAVLDERIDAF